MNRERAEARIVRVMRALSPWERLRDDLLEQIEAGTLAPGNRVQSVRDLSRQHDLSVRSVLRALRALEGEGRLVSRPRSGFFVSPNPGGRPGLLSSILIVTHTDTLPDERDCFRIDYYITPFLRELTRQAEARGATVSMRALSEARHHEQGAPLRFDASAVVVCGAKTLERFIARCPADRSPALVTVGARVGSDIRGRPFDNISIDSEYDVQMCCDHLYRLGHRRIALLTFRRSRDQREDGLRLAAEHLPGLDARLLVDDVPGMGDFVAFGERLAVQALAVDPPPTALICGNDQMAYGVMNACREQRRRIPDELSLIGLDDLPPSAHTLPPLTTCRSPVKAMAREALAMLESRLRAPELERRLALLNSELIERDSCGPPSAP